MAEGYGVQHEAWMYVNPSQVLVTTLLRPILGPTDDLSRNVLGSILRQLLYCAQFECNKPSQGAGNKMKELS